MSRLLAPFNLLAALPLASVVDAPVRLVNAISRALPLLEQMTADVGEMREGVGRMADGVERLESSVQGLREDVQAFDENIGGINRGVEALRGQVDGMAESLIAIDALAARLGWLGSRRRRKGAADPDVPEPPDETGDAGGDTDGAEPPASATSSG